MNKKKVIKQDGISVTMRVERVDFLATLFKIIIKTCAILLAALAAFGTAVLILHINDGKNDVQAILVVTLCTIIWIAIMIKLLMHRKDFEYNDIQLTSKGDAGFKYDNIILRFNITNEYKKKNLKLSSYNTSSIIVDIGKLYNRYRVRIIDSGEFNNKVREIAQKNNIVIKVIQED